MNGSLMGHYQFHLMRLYDRLSCPASLCLWLQVGMIIHHHPATVDGYTFLSNNNLRFGKITRLTSEIMKFIVRVLCFWFLLHRFGLVWSVGRTWAKKHC